MTTTNSDHQRSLEPTESRCLFLGVGWTLPLFVLCRRKTELERSN